MSSDPFAPPASEVHAPVSTGVLAAVGLVYAVSAAPCCWVLFVLIALRDICAPPNPAMDPLFPVFTVGGPLLAAAFAGYAFAALPDLRRRFGSSFVLGCTVAGTTTLVLVVLAELSRAWAGGGTVGEVVQAGVSGFPSAVFLAAIGACGFGWVPAVGTSLVLRWVPR